MTVSSQVLTGDCLTVMPTLVEKADPIVTDPPYGLKFMGKAWDHGVPGAEFWTEAKLAARPGAHLVAFGGTRTYHRLACAIEDAGWEIVDCIAWLYGQGFPKHDSKLKPAFEPIVMARAPGPVHALSIDACRIAANDVEYARNCSGDRGHGGARDASDDLGRWPANVVLDEESAAQLDAQSGLLTSGANPTRRGSPKTRNTYGAFEGQRECVAHRGEDSGGASRFFYCAKASRAERDAGLEGFEKKPLHWSNGEANPGSFQSPGTDRSARNNHPTVKPLDLMRWLCRLITPKGGLILDPFCGSGSTGRAAIAEGFRFIGIELSDEYAAIARARIADYAPLFSDEGPRG